MLPLVIAMLLCVGLAVAVVVIVAMPARREGRDILAPRGEAVVERVKGASSATRDKTSELLGRKAD